jgi:hypothetical protein
MFFKKEIIKLFLIIKIFNIYFLLYSMVMHHCVQGPPFLAILTLSQLLIYNVSN